MNTAGRRSAAAATKILGEGGSPLRQRPREAGAGIFSRAGQDAGGTLAQQLMGGLGKTAESAALDTLGGKIGKTAAGKIVGWLDGLSLREREELMERLAEVIGVDTATLFKQLYGNYGN